MNIIIIEDDPMVSQLNEQYLNRLEGVTVAARFSNGKDALEYLAREPVALAIVDMYMPRMNGLELLRAIRGAGIQTAVIMVTAATEMQVVEEALRLGIEDYIIKPFSFSRLQEAVRRYMTKVQYVKCRDKADQTVVDQLLHNTVSPEKSDQALRKGLSAKTLAFIEKLIRENPDAPHTCESISAESGLSKVTVRHYLNYLIETDTLRSSIDYETGGRPRVLYRLK